MSSTKTAAIRPEVRLQAHHRDMLSWARGKPGAIANHGTGLGKTLQAFAIAEDVGGRCVVIAPKTVVSQFSAKVKTFITEDRHDAYTFLTYADFIADPSIIERLSAKMVVVDEYHQVSQRPSLRKALEEARAASDFFLLGLTATLFVVSPADVVPLVNLVHGSPVWSEQEFRRLYLRIRSMGPGGHSYQAMNLDDFGRRVAPLIHRIEATEETNRKLPSVYVETSHVAMRPDQQRRYAAALREAQVDIQSLNAEAQDTPAPRLREAVQRAQRLLGDAPDAKVERVVRDVASGDTKAAIVALGTEGSGLRQLVAGLQGMKRPLAVVRATGGRDQVREEVERFNGGQAQAIVLPHAASEGVSLRGARRVLLPNVTDVPATEDQAIGRAARLDSHTDLPPNERRVDVRKYVLKGQGQQTTDEWLLAVSQKRRALHRAFEDAIIPGRHGVPGRLPHRT